MHKLLVVTAHPDDEAFGPAGTLAKYAEKGVEIHLLCATRGEAGKRSQAKGNRQKAIGKSYKLHHVREKELLKSAKILGVKKVEFLDFVDGTLCNAVYHSLADKITAKIRDFQPQAVLTLDRLGISGHLDHIAVSMITTYAFLKARKAGKLYYHCLPKEYRTRELDNYFIYFPEGYDQKDITTRISYDPYWKTKVMAMQQHQSQKHDVERILSRISSLPKVDHFILHKYFDIKVKFPETDLFAGIGD